MYTQVQTYRDGVDMTLEETYKEDLPKSGFLSFILLQINAQQDGTPFQDVAYPMWRICDYIDDISIIADGRSDIVTLPGTVLQFQSFLDQGITPYDVIREYSNATQRQRFLINFGKHMWDPDHALSLADFDNVELNITNSLDSDDWQSADVKIFLGWLRDVGSLPDNRVRVQELWREYTTAQDGIEYLELPTALRIRRLLLQVYPDYDANGKAETSPYSVLQEILMTFQDGRLTVWDDDIEQLWVQNYTEFGFENIVQASNYHFADNGFDVGLGSVRGFGAISGARDGAASGTVPTRLGDQDDYTQAFESYEADSPVDYMARGMGYQNCGVFRFDRYPDERDLLDPSTRGMGTVELQLHTRNQAAAADGTVRVVLDRLATPTQISR